MDVSSAKLKNLLRRKITLSVTQRYVRNEANLSECTEYGPFKVCETFIFFNGFMGDLKYKTLCETKSCVFFL